MPSSHRLTTRADQVRCQCCTPNSRSGVGSAAIRPARIAAQIGGYCHRVRGFARVTAPWEGLAAHRVGVASRVHHRPPGRQAIRVHSVPDIPAAPAAPGADQRTVARYPTRAPGGTAAGPTASPERQDAHARGVSCEPAAPLGAGGPARRPAARRAARPWRGTRGRSWPAPRQRLPAGLCGRLWLSHCRSRESCPEIHPQQDEHQP